MIIEKLLTPFMLLIPTFFIGMLFSAYQFFLLPINILSLKETSHPYLDLFGIVSSLLVMAVCVTLIFRKEYWLIPAVLFVGFALSALYTSLPILLNLERDRSGDGMSLLGTPAALIFLGLAGVMLFAFGKGTVVVKILSVTLMVLGFVGYVAWSFIG